MTEMKTLTVNGQAYTLADTWARDALKELQIAAGAPAIVSQTAGSLIAVADAADRALAGLKVYGRTQQNGTPAPDAPAAIVSAGSSGSVGITVAGKNLCPGYKAGAYSNTTGVYASNAQGYYCTEIIPVITGEEYVQSNGIGKEISDIHFFSASGQWLGRKAYDYINKRPDGAAYMAFNYYTSIDLGWVQVEGEVVATQYEPYTAQTIDLSVPNGLPGIPVSSGGNYTDENGQQWSCDEIDFARGVYVQRVGMHSFDGTESIIEVADLGENVRIAIAAGFVGVKSRGLFSHGVYTTGHSNDTAHAYCNENKYAYLFLPVEEATADAVREYLADQYNNGTPVTILAPLVIPAETALDEKSLTAYAAMHTNKPNTTVMNDAGAHMKLSYVADTKSYIDDKFTELQHAVLAAGANI